MRPTTTPIEPRSKYVKANGIRHHYLEWGDPADSHLLMLHAAGLCAQVWQPLAQKLAQQFHVIAFDQRGHGDTDASDRGYSFQLAGEDLAALVQTLDLTDLYVVGHSSGGLSTLISGSILPGRFNRVVLTETRVASRPSLAQPEELQHRAQRTRMKRSIWDSRELMYAGYRNRAAFRDWHEDAFRAFIEGGTRLLADGRAKLKCLPETEACFYEQRDTLDTTQFLRGLQGQYLLLLGDYPGCQTMQDDGVQQFLSLVKGASVKLMGKGSHFLPMEHPDAVVKEVIAFLTED